MNAEDLESPRMTDNILFLVAAAIFLIQLLIFFLYYNFSTNIYVLGIGWLLLIPGLAFVILSAKDDSKEKERLYKFTMYPMHIGWSIVSLSLSLITQGLSYIFALVFVSLMILDIHGLQSSK
ncbi:MAG: hypothetical protein ACTSW8_01290 [Candidatus Thorarchaeota archaeon]